MANYFTKTVKLYSEVLFSYAVENNLAASFAKELGCLKSLIEKDPSLIKHISAPIFTISEQEELVLKISKVLNLSKDIISFMDVLLRHKRFGLLPLIIDNFLILEMKYRGIQMVEVTMSHSVSDKEQATVELKLEKLFSTKLDLKFKEDKQIISGMIVKTENKMFDASLKTKFMNLKNSYTNKIALL